MLKRLLVGLFEGSFAGALVALPLSSLVGGAHSAPLMYAGAALSGALTGVIAGQPIWAKDAKIEGLLKAAVGAFIAVTVLFGLRKWLSGVTVDLTAMGGGAGPLGDVAWAALPAIGIALALVLEIDDAFGPDPGLTALRHRVATQVDAEPMRVDSTSAEDEVSGDEKRSGRV